MANVGYATLQVIPVAQGFASKLAASASGEFQAAGAASGEKMGSGVLSAAKKFAAPLAAVFGGLAIGKVAEDSVKLQAQFSQTMNTMAAVADVPAAKIKDLSALAVKMGADTVFSANDAADAMLELAKGGISAADIQAGALSGTLTLAAAGGTDLATAATIASNAMNTFGLSGKNMNSIAAALAGGANASSASVESLGEALGQVGPGAKNAGLSLQETVAVLSAFDAAGIKGSDAGTSLKTMLNNLVPQTKAAKDEMADLGLKFTDAQGNFVDITQVAEQLKDKLGGLSEAQRTQALNTIFGSDASRAATVLMNEGSAGLEKFIKATNDAGAAQRVAAARMSGTAGAIEQMHGALETAELSLGQFLAPAVTKAAKDLAAGFGAVSGALNGLHAGPALGDALVAASGLAVALTAASVAGKAYAAVVGIVKGATALWTAEQWSLDAAMDANPIGAVILAIAALTAAVIAVIKYHKQIGAAFTAAWHGIEDVANAVGRWFAGPFLAPFKATAAWFAGPFLSPFKSIGAFFGGPFLAPFKAIGSFFSGPFLGFFTKTIPAAASAVGNFFTALPGEIGHALAALPGVLFNAAQVAFDRFFYAIGFGIGEIIKEWLAFPGQVVAAANAMWDALKSAFVNGIGALVQLDQYLWSQLVAAFNAGVHAVVSFAQSLWSAITSAFSTGVSATVSFFAQLPGRLVTLAGDIRSGVLSTLSAMWSGVVSGVTTGVTATIGWFQRLPGNVVSIFNSVRTNAVNIASSIVSGTVSFFAQLPGRAASALSSLAGAVKNAVSGAGSWLYNAGKDVVQGLINGIEGAVGAAVKAVKRAMGDIIAGAKDALGVHSPSRVFHQIGLFVSQGMANGLQAGRSTILKASSALMPAVPSAALAGGTPETVGASNVSRRGAALNIEHYYESGGSARGTAEELMLLMTARGY